MLTKEKIIKYLAEFGGYEAAVEICKNPPEGANYYWAYHKCYAKQTSSFNIACLWGTETHTSTQLWQYGKWSTYSSSGYPNLTSLDSLRNLVHEYNKLHGIYVPECTVVWRESINPSDDALYVVKQAKQTHVVVGGMDGMDVKISNMYIRYADDAELEQNKRLVAVV